MLNLMLIYCININEDWLFRSQSSGIFFKTIRIKGKKQLPLIFTAGESI